MQASVVIPTKNGGDRFIDVLATTAGQITSFEYEILCVDSGSKDSTIDVIKAFPRVKLFQIAPEEFGHGKTRSWAAQHCSGEYIVFITQDALPASLYWLQNFINAMRAAPDAVAGFGIHYPYPDCNYIDARNITNHFKQFGEDNTTIQVSDLNRFKEDLDYRLQYAFFSDNNACLKREYFLLHPYPDVDFAEDQSWMMEQMGKGLKKVYCPHAPVYHSHNYGLIETAQRAFDESRALKHLFGWAPITNGRLIPRTAWTMTRDDWSYLATLEMSLLTKTRAFISTPLRNLAKQFGSHEGCVYDGCTPARQRRMDSWLSQFAQQTAR